MRPRYKVRSKTRHGERQRKNPMCVNEMRKQTNQCSNGRAFRVDTAEQVSWQELVEFYRDKTEALVVAHSAGRVTGEDIKETVRAHHTRSNRPHEGVQTSLSAERSSIRSRSCRGLFQQVFIQNHPSFAQTHSGGYVTMGYREAKMETSLEAIAGI